MHQDFFPSSINLFDYITTENSEPNLFQVDSQNILAYTDCT